MFLIFYLFNSLSTILTSEWITSALLFITVYYVVKCYLIIDNYPKGPFPLPIVGNIFHLFQWSYICDGKNPLYEWENLRKKYGSVYTLWFGMNPIIIVNDAYILKEAFQINGIKFSNRPLTFLEFAVTDGKGKDIIFSHYGPTWAILRKVIHGAVRTYSMNKQFAVCLSTITKEAIDNMIKDGITEKPIDISHYLYLTMINVVVSSTFGKTYKIEDQEFIEQKNLIYNFFRRIDRIAIFAGLPQLLQHICKKYGNFDFATQIKKICKNRFEEHMKSYQKGVIRDFADALIAAREESIEENKETQQMLNIENITNMLWDLFIAGIDNSLHTIQWGFLFMANYVEIQMNLRKEVKEMIGDRMPVQSDKNNCHYIMAFIRECLRSRPILSLAVPHSTACHTKLGDYKISKDTIVISNLYSILNDTKYWHKPEVFNPNRFLDENGKLILDKSIAYVPFGIGMRYCVGEKLAYNQIFLILCNILQLTDGYLFTLPNGTANIEPSPHSFLNCKPNPFKIILKKF